MPVIHFQACFSKAKWNQDKFNSDNVEQYNTKRSELQGRTAAAQSRISDAQLAITKFDGLSQDAITKEDFEAKTAAEKILSEAKAEKAQCETQLSNLKKPHQVVYGGAYANKVFPNPAALHSVFPGKNYKQIQQTLKLMEGDFKNNARY